MQRTVSFFKIINSKFNFPFLAQPFSGITYNFIYRFGLLQGLQTGTVNSNINEVSYEHSIMWEFEIETLMQRLCSLLSTNSVWVL